MADLSRKRARLGWLLPPVLAIVAIGLQFALDVPHGAMLLREEPEIPEQRTTAARTPRTPKKYKKRGAAYVQRLRKSWSAKPLAAEPKDRRFAGHHEELLHAVARKAEAAAAPGEEPTLVETRVECHSIRCELELCAPTQLAQRIADQLPKFRVGKQSLWHELRELDGERAQPGARACHRYVVDFAVEGADPRSLRIQP